MTLGTYAIARKREDDRLRLYSANFESLGVIESSLNDLVPSEAAGWTNYPKGVMWTFEKRGYKLTNGLDILIYGNIPNGSGLSSSASLEVLTGVLLKDMFAFDDLTMVEIAQIGSIQKITLMAATVELWISLQARWERKTMLFSWIPIRCSMNMHRLCLKMQKL